jgi:hypothetical protein
VIFDRLRSKSRVGISSPRQNAGISFCMIVRNGANGLAGCLASVAPLVDEMIVLDTGSCDRSVEIARSFGASVHRSAWTGDFAAARNQYLDLAHMPWILSLDADERLAPVSPDALRAMLPADRRTGFGFTVRNHFHRQSWPKVLAPSELGGRISADVFWTASRTVRLFPRARGLRYRYPVHESLVPALREGGFGLRVSPFPIDHHSSWGGLAPPSIVPGAAATKAALYRELGLRKVRQFPGYFRGHLELGRVLLEESRFGPAERSLRASIRLNPLCASAYYCLALALLGQELPAAETAQLLRLAPLPRIDRTFLDGLLHLRADNREAATSAFEAVLAEKADYAPARLALPTLAP